MGAGLPNPFALVLLNPTARANAALEREFEDLLDAVNADLETHERVAFLAVVEGPWSVENDLMTPTMKLRRSNLEQHYLPQVEGWREQGRKVVWAAASVPLAAGT